MVDISILFGVESGSRAWGIESEDSDFDVRFVYHYPKAEYLKLFSTIDETKDDFLEINGSELDLVGWDIFKFLRLVAKSNPTALEWIQSPIIYIDNPVLDELKKIIANFSRFTLVKHYYSMALSNYRKYIEINDSGSLKNWLYVIRSLLNAIYIIEFQQFPALRLEVTLNKLRKEQKHGIELIADEILSLLEIKRGGSENDQAMISSAIKFWVRETLDQFEQSADVLNLQYGDSDISKDKLEHILHNILLSKI